jgi:hypothetical protein
VGNWNLIRASVFGRARDSLNIGMMMLRWAPTHWSLSDPRCGVSSSGSRWWGRPLFWGLPG